jgi:hypothetical protein
MVVSTDLSHYHSYDEARAIDGATVRRIAALATDIDHDEACGATPLNGLLHSARRKQLSMKLLGVCNSGDTAGGKDRVVGYSSFGLYEGGEVSLDSAGTTLLTIARGAIEQQLLGKEIAPHGSAWLRQAGATFVTLTKGGELRGCIGSLQAARPLGEDVADNAQGAAFRDPRFPALGAFEWPQCRVEVSLLGAPTPISFSDEADLVRRIRPGEDGLILEADGRRATFLPQVWQSMPDTRVFLRELVRKAGLPADTALARCTISRYRVVRFGVDRADGR